ncbi:EscU/YscU/HrcU family type III secretion system export apparatus switch protein [Thalassoroseus pseudoceratinae]|uniref:EscU/YscU/HrcU family type III secretion system export apparatus switch protein n=1 Tax=Thalassoroseus pseudoceratinae TaxID=2713176 RepID=UPI001423E84B|nr:EscU/YscU/HrcU family type III secretion system export apparatus switch protein [Thalassoroseus pseudoceratinae]
MADTSQDRTEEPTENRRREARKQGQVAKSSDLTASGLMLAAATAILVFGFEITQSLCEHLAEALANASSAPIDKNNVLALLRNATERLLLTIAPLMMLMLLAAVGLNVMQVGFLYSTEALQPKFSRLNPLSGFRRIYSVQAVAKLGMSVGKLAIVVTVAVFFISTILPSLLQLGHLEWDPNRFELAETGFRETRVAGQLWSGVRDSLVTLAFQMAAALIALGVADWAFQRWKHTQDLRMTKQEIRDEMKQFDGDPHIRQRRREVHRKLAEAREIQQTETADVVITNPTHISVAIKYDPVKMAAPIVVAKGQGEIALKIRQIAAAHSIPIIERKPLARALYHQVKVGREVPIEMYEVFVEILAYVYSLTGRKPEDLAGM